MRAVRERFGDEVLLQVDANTAYTLADARHLARLDPFDLLLIEQPLDEEDVLGHADLARQIRTPICLDESIVSAQSAAAAIRLGACQIVNIKPGRVGGYLEARRIHDLCVAHGVPVWCGGMLETGLGRAANVALAALPGFTLPGDTSASGRYYAPTSRRRSCSTTATWPCRPGRAWASRPCTTSSPRSPRARSGSLPDAESGVPSALAVPAYLRSQSRDQGLQAERPGRLRVGDARGAPDLRERFGREVLDGGLRGLTPCRQPALQCDRESRQGDCLHRAVGVLGRQPGLDEGLQCHLERRRCTRSLDRTVLERSERTGVGCRDRADRGEEAADPSSQGTGTSAASPRRSGAR